MIWGQNTEAQYFLVWFIGSTMCSPSKDAMKSIDLVLEPKPSPGLGCGIEKYLDMNEEDIWLFMHNW